MCVWCVVCVTVLTKIIYLTFDRGESKIFQKGPLVACAWHDSKVLTVLSTTSQPVAMGSVLRRQRDGGVDRGDQIRGYYSCRTRSRKFYKYIILYFLFDVSITNAFILHTNYTSKPNRNVKDFRLQLAKELIGTYYSRRLPGRSSRVQRPLQLQHFPLKMCLQPPAKRCKRGWCAFCWKDSNKRTDRCNECGVWLCHGGNPTSDCFYLWHKNL